jgi:hypothetical protein
MNSRNKKKLENLEATIENQIITAIKPTWKNFELSFVKIS